MAGLVLVMHKMRSDERKCAVMKGCLCSDELRRRNKWFTEYLLLREHKEGIETCKKQHVGMHRNPKKRSSRNFSGKCAVMNFS